MGFIWILKLKNLIAAAHRSDMKPLNRVENRLTIFSKRGPDLYGRQVLEKLLELE